MSTQLERNLQTKILYQLNRYPVVAAAIPNGLWIPSHNEKERALVARIVARMKSDGMLTPGAPDLVLLGAKGALCVELKRPATNDLYGKKPKGRLSPEQKAFKQRCDEAGVGYLVAYEWADVECSLGGCAARDPQRFWRLVARIAADPPDRLCGRSLQGRAAPQPSDNLFEYHAEIKQP